MLAEIAIVVNQHIEAITYLNKTLKLHVVWHDQFAERLICVIQEGI